MNSQLERFIEGYLAAALYFSTDRKPGTTEEDNEDVNLDEFDWAPGEAEKLHDDCREFMTLAEVSLALYVEQHKPVGGHDVWECAGQDFWLTRNRHGVGYWDRGMGELGANLTVLANSFGELHLYLGDDELVYVG